MPTRLIAIILSVLLGAAYLASLTINTAVITALRADNFALFFIVLAVLAGFISYAFASAIENRLLRRLVMIGTLALALFAGGSAGRAFTIQRLFAQQVTAHGDALPIAIVKSGSISLQSPYTRAVFDLPTTIPAASGFAGFGHAGQCARVQIEETAGGDKRIVKSGPPISEDDIVTCPAR